MAIAEIASANTIAMIIAVNIFGVAEGLRPNAVMLAKALAMMTEMGPRTHKLKIKTKATFRDIVFLNQSTVHSRRSTEKLKQKNLILSQPENSVVRGLWTVDCGLFFCLLHDRGHLVSLDLNDPAKYRNFLLVNEYYTTNQATQKGFMEREDFKDTELSGKDRGVRPAFKDNFLRGADEDVDHN